MSARIRPGRVAFVAVLALAAGTHVPAQSKLVAGFDPARLSRIDGAVADAITAHQLPGAVVVVGRGDTVVYRPTIHGRGWLVMTDLAGLIPGGKYKIFRVER